jgi:hypothetical protein
MSSIKHQPGHRQHDQSPDDCDQFYRSDPRAASTIDNQYYRLVGRLDIWLFMLQLARFIAEPEDFLENVQIRSGDVALYILSSLSRGIHLLGGLPA